MTNFKCWLKKNCHHENDYVNIKVSKGYNYLGDLRTRYLIFLVLSY